MATYTDNYNLTKPTMSELADIRTINGNMDTVDEIMHGSQVSIADAYDPTQTYDVGDHVMYDFLLYKCITAVTTPEAFDANKWTRATAIGEIPTDTFTGATSQTAGSKGLVPAPSVGDQNKYLKANGTWDTPAGGGGGGGIDYSTTEQNTGLKWIDGSDIYQITLTGSGTGIAGSLNIDISSLGASLVMIDFGASYIKRSDTNETMPLAYMNKDSLQYSVGAIFNSSFTQLYLNTGQIPFGNYAITLKYTKSTS